MVCGRQGLLELLLIILDGSAPASKSRGAVLRDMKNNLRLSVAYSFLPLVAVAFVFGALFSVDSQVTLGFSDIAWVKKAEENADPQKFFDSLTSEAKRRGINIAKIGADSAHPETGQQLDMMVGDTDIPSARWPDSGYPRFNQSQDVNVAVRQRAEDDPLGWYLIYGDRERAQGLLSQVGSSSGYSGTQYGMFSADNVIRSMGGTPLVSAFVSSVGIIVFSISSSILLGSRRYARKRLNGASPWEVFRHDIADISVPLLGSTAITGTLSTVFLATYNDLAFASLFFRLSVAALVVLVVVCLAVHAVTVLFCMRVPVADALKGKQPARLVYVSMGLARGFAILMILVTSFGTIQTALVLRSHTESRSSWESNKQAYFVDIAGAVRSQDEEDQLAQWFAGEVKLHNIIVAHRDNLMAATVNEPPQSEGSVLFVNDEYLHHNAQRFPDADRAIRQNPDAMRLFLPERSDTTVEQVLDHLPYGVDRATAGDIQISHYESTKPVFDYGWSLGLNRIDSFNPVVVYLPPEQIAAIPGDVSAWATQGDALVIDRESAQTRLKESGVKSMVHGITNARLQQAKYAREARTDVLLSVYSVCLLLLLLLFATIEFSRIHVSERDQRLFRGHLFGESWSRGLRHVLWMETVVGLALGCWILRRTRSAVETAVYFGASSQESFEYNTGMLVFGALLMIVNVSIMLGSMNRTYRHHISRRSRDA